MKTKLQWALIIIAAILIVIGIIQRNTPNPTEITNLDTATQTVDIGKALGSGGITLDN